MIDKNFDSYRISDVLMSSYKLIWDDFCSWLLEILKPGYGIIHHPNILHGDSQNTGRHTRISIEIRIFNTKKYKIREIFNKNFYY